MPVSAADRLVVRPQGPRIVAYAVAVLMLVSIIAIGRALPDYVYFSVSERITMWLLAVAVLALLHGVGRSVVKADPEGIDVVNGYKRHHLTWDQVEGISMKAGAPWATLVTKDDERVILFAIQSSDGDGREIISQLRAWAA